MAIIFLDARGKWHTRNGTLSPLRSFSKDTPRGTAPGTMFSVNQKEVGRGSPRKRTLVNGVGKVPFVEYRVSPANQSTLFDLAATRRIRLGE